MTLLSPNEGSYHSKLIQSADQRSGVLNYVYDKIGRIQEARNSQTGRNETFAFDPQTQGRLKSPANPNPVSGNRLKEYNGISNTPTTNWATWSTASCPTVKTNITNTT